MVWYYADAGRQVGPVEESALDDLVRQGVVRDDTLVWKEGMAAWQPHASVRGARAAAPMPGGSFAPVAAAAAAAPVAESRFCSECGRPFPASELVSIGSATVCAQCKPVFMQRMREGGERLGQMRYGGFWIRWVARLIDWVLLSILNFIIQLPLRLMMGVTALGTAGFGPNPSPAALGQFLAAISGYLAIATLLTLLIGASYETYFVSTRGGTLGKLAVGLKIVRRDGSSVTAGRALGRYFARIVSRIPIYIGHIMAGITDQKQSLHDMICDTRVIYVR
jgi:uncharacterized RDD family membrane protein YckC